MINENLRLIFAGRFWFSNLAYFNEAKRYMKMNMQSYNDDVVADTLSALSFDLSSVKQLSPNKKITAYNFDIIYNS